MDIIEVSPRDGLQNEKTLVPTAAKVKLILRALGAGLARIEVTSFVNPARVPQMADAADVCAAVTGLPGLCASGLVLNEKGFDRAQVAGCREINFVVVASETFNRRNQGVSISDTIAAWRNIGAAARHAGLFTTVTIGASFGCPFEGEIPAAAVFRVVEQLMVCPPDEIAFADTIGCGVPVQVRTLLGGLRSLAPGVRSRFHFHDTRRTGIANVLAAAEAGAGAIDASIGGTGGCPFAPAATGNVATEDVVYVLERMGMSTGVNLDAVIEAARKLEEVLGKPSASGLARAGTFPVALGKIA